MYVENERRQGEKTDRISAAARFSRYLKEHCIRHTTGVQDGMVRKTMSYMGMNDSPDKIIESCVLFTTAAFEVSVYFDSNAAHWCAEHPENHGELFRLFNFLNAEIWPRGVDFSGAHLYGPEYLYNPRFYLTEDGNCDICMSFKAAYDVYEIAELETNDFITAACPDLMNSLSPFIFGVVLGQMSAKEAIYCIKETILKDGYYES